ncbi:LytTr DNA-binding domain-containing protein [Reichenbachiella faecimaris]|uniref:LytTr DNA-binding domain-containing protein n=1 Tax=Reichenbachiella faecimaris TaxID=692418 RepID=A0A1W2G7N1_REIFA|nr:LytTR family DNA-binding domain-containing protein [Reichenbachiella faecimaris]SMD32690.1 LytTr DNA-binding domain-containing protein [Reichenbachiella faecimaris]
MHQINLRRIAEHLLYWLGLIAFLSVVWGSSDGNYPRNLIIQFYSLPSRLILVYTTLYLLIPHFLLKKQFTRFALAYLFLLVLVGLVIQRPLMLYHVQPIYLPEWNVSSFFIISELMNTLLDVNLAAILPVGNSLYNLWVSSNEKLETNAQKFIYLKVEKRLEKVVIDDIIYVESLKNYIKVKTTEKEIVAYRSLTVMEEALPVDKFLRVHRSFIIGLTYVESFSPNQIQLGAIKIPVGRTYKEEVKKRLGYF